MKHKKINNKIAFKLTLYFAVALIIFSIIIGSVFMVLFRKHTLQVHKTELEEKALHIAQTMASFDKGQCNGKGRGYRGGTGYGAYMEYLDEFALADVWIVDERLELNTCGHKNYAYEDLPPHAEEVIKEVFTGKTAFSESFSKLLDVPTLTVGTPIKTAEGKITGVVLLHSPVSGTNEAISQGIKILLISIGIALILVVLLAILFSLTFTKPLNRMKNTALHLVKGEYAFRNNIVQKDEIGELAQTIDTLAEHLERADKQSERLEKVRQDFVANISHELRTPITVIRGSLEALCDEVVEDPLQVKSYYEQMLIEVKGLQRLVGDLLDLSKLQNADFAIEMEPLNLCDILSDVIRSTKNMVDRKALDLQVKGIDESCRIVGDYGRLRQMFMIVMDNAIKFSPLHGQIQMDLVRKEALKVIIYNEGPCIGKEDLPYIFDRFYKTKAVENKMGTGLGLPIAKQIALRHEMTIEVENGEKTGCRFIFTLKDK